MQYTFMGYVIACSLTLIMCYIVYVIFLESKLQPEKNRRVVISIYILMFSVPLLSALFPTHIDLPSIEIDNLKAQMEPQMSEYTIVGKDIMRFDIARFISTIYIIGIIISFILTSINLIRLFIIHKSSERISLGEDEVYLHNHRKLSSYSWINHIYLRSEIRDKPKNERLALILHERAHITKRHYVDLILAQTVIIFQWFNPASWLLRAELQRIHEYEADAEVLKSGMDEKDYQLMLIDNISRHRFTGLTDGLNNCSLKKRILMMQTKNFKSGSLARTGFVILAAAVAGAIIHIPALASALSENKPNATINEESTFVSETVIVSEANKDEKEDYSKYKGSDNIYTAAEVMPMYKGGMEELMNDIAKCTRYPETALKNEVQGRVVVQFVVQSDGKIGNDIKVVRSVDKDLDEAAIKTIKALPNDWTPGTVDGKAVSCLYTVPINFKLSKDTKKAEEQK